MDHLCDIKKLDEKELFWREIEQDVICCLINKGNIGIDVGANTGSYVKTLLSHGCSCIAFECNPRLYKLLVSRFSDATNVQISDQAVSSKQGLSVMRIPIHGESESDGGSTIEPMNTLHDAEGVLSIEVACCKLDDVITDPFSLLKIDVEGHELEVLKGARKCLTTWRPVVICECENRHRDNAISELFSFFSDIDFIGFFIFRHRLYDAANFSKTLQDPALFSGLPRREVHYVNNFIFVHMSQAREIRSKVERKLYQIRLQNWLKRKLYDPICRPVIC